MAESRSKSNARHLARVLETGAALIGHGDADAPPARLLNAHFAAIRTLGSEGEAAETVCEAIRARRMSPIAPVSLIEHGHGVALQSTQLLSAVADATALASARAVATQAFVAVADALEALTIETDDQGRPTQQPRFTVVPPLGALLTTGAHKGYGLALVCELLGGALAAGLTTHDHDNSKRRVLNGMFSVLLDPAALAGGEDGLNAFEAEAQAFIAWVQASPAREGFGPVQVAGDAERAHRARRSAEGVPVDATTWQEILAAAQSLGVSPAAVNAAAGLG